MTRSRNAALIVILTIVLTLAVGCPVYFLAYAEEGGGGSGAPAITGLDPSTGPAAGGTTVTITGTGFTGATAVEFGTVAIAPEDFTVDSDTQITATSPPHPEGVVHVRVTTPVGESAQTSADEYSFVAQGNLISTEFGTRYWYTPDTDSFTNSMVDCYQQSMVGLTNTADSTHEYVLGIGTLGGPVLSLHAAGEIDMNALTSGFESSGGPPATDFTWDNPPVAENEGTGAWAGLTSSSSVAPGFDITRSLDQKVFDSDGGTQTMTLTVTAREDIESLFMSGEGNPRVDFSDYTAELVSVEWQTTPPGGWAGDFGGGTWRAGASNITSGTCLVLIVKYQVASTQEGSEVYYKAPAEISNNTSGNQSAEPQTSTSLSRDTAVGTWTWTADKDYLWSWSESESRIVHWFGDAEEVSSNQVSANFVTGRNYYTDGNSVSNISLDGDLFTATSLQNDNDPSGESILGPSEEGGPELNLAATSEVGDVNRDGLAWGDVPGTNFGWRFTAVGDNEGRGSWAGLGDVSFTPGFSVTRAADETVIDSIGGLQTLTITVTAEEDIDLLGINGNIHPGDGLGYTASLVSVEWETEPSISIIEPNDDGFSARINDVSTGSTYTLIVTTEVASALEGVDVNYMPDVEIVNLEQLAHSASPEVTNRLAGTTSGGTWIWTVRGTCVWNWWENEARVVHLSGLPVYNKVNAGFDARYRYQTGADTVENEALDGSLEANTNIWNQDDDSDAPVLGLGAAGGPGLTLEAVQNATDVNGDDLVSGELPGTSFAWGYTAVGENEGRGPWANLGEVSFTPGFSVTRSYDNTVFDTTGGVQTLTFAFVAAEDMETLTIDANTHPDEGDWPHYTADVLSVAWASGAPPSAIADFDDRGFFGEIGGVESGSAYTLVVTIQVESTLEGADVYYMPYVTITNQSMVGESPEPEISDSLSRVTAAGTWTWTLDSAYEWAWRESLSRVVELGGTANAFLNRVNANFDTERRYDTDADSVDNVLLDGSTNLNVNLWDDDDPTGEAIRGSGSAGGPELTLEATSEVGDVNRDGLVSGEVPGPNFAWDFAPVLGDEGIHSWANTGDFSFTPGFSVERIPSETVFDSIGGEQTLTVRVTADQDLEVLNINGYIRPEGSGSVYHATLVGVQWGTEPQDSYLENKEDGFSGSVNNVEAGSTYTIILTTLVSSALDGVDVTFMPDVDVSTYTLTDQSDEPEIASSLSGNTSGVHGLGRCSALVCGTGRRLRAGWCIWPAGRDSTVTR